MNTLCDNRITERAFRLAHTGRHAGWEAIEQELQSEGFPLDSSMLDDAGFREGLNHICAEANMGTYRDA